LRSILFFTLLQIALNQFSQNIIFSKQQTKGALKKVRLVNEISNCSRQQQAQINGIFENQNSLHHLVTFLIVYLVLICVGARALSRLAFCASPSSLFTTTTRRPKLSGLSIRLVNGQNVFLLVVNSQNLCYIRRRFVIVQIGIERPIVFQNGNVGDENFRIAQRVLDLGLGQQGLDDWQVCETVVGV
jgi:hypothetical protein